MSDTDFRNITMLVKAAARNRFLFLSHAVKQMSRPDRMVTVQEVRGAVLHGEIIEDYPEDARGHSCLMLGQGEGGRKIHVVCTPRDGYVAVITAYVPEVTEWDSKFKTRRQT